MKMMVIGIGQCGNRIADEFSALGDRARRERGARVITDAFAFDTDSAALRGLQNISSKDRRITLGELRTRGHGTGGINTLGGQVAREEGYKLVDLLRQGKRLDETDAFLLTAGAAGGTGSGAMPVFMRTVKQRFPDRPVYGLVVLPFEHEEELEPRIAYNTALCLKAVINEADAVFLVDNQRYAAKDRSLAGNIAKTNRHIVNPFFSLLCAGEETKRKHIGISILDAGGIIQSLNGWTVLGYGKTDLPLITMPWDEVQNRGNLAIDAALRELSLQCDTRQAARALYLVSAPSREMNMDLVKYLGERIRTNAPSATMRFGDYPINKGLIDVTVIFSGLNEVEKVTGYYTSFSRKAEEMKKKNEAFEGVPSSTDDASKDVVPPV